MIHIDTHVLVWLWERKAKYAKLLARRIEDEVIVVSPAALVELQCIREIGRFKDSPEKVVAGLAESIGLSVSGAPFDDIAQMAMALSWTRDPFDRLIVANAITDGARLLTFDDRIHANFDGAL